MLIVEGNLTWSCYFYLQNVQAGGWILQHWATVLLCSFHFLRAIVT
jgi:hypothetical protein